MNKSQISPFAIHSIVAPLLLTFASTDSAAQSFEPTWQLEADLAVVEPSGNAVAVDASPAGVDVDFDAKVGAGLRLEYQFTKVLALELGALGASGFDVSVGGADNVAGVASRIDGFAPVTLGLNLHLDTGNRIDLYAGPFLAAIRYGDVTVETAPGSLTTRESSDTSFGWGAIAGIDVPIGSGGWSLQANVRYIRTAIDLSSDDGAVESDFDPTILSIGFGYRF